MNGKLYAFRLGTTGPVWALAGTGRVWIRSLAMAEQHQIDTATVARVGSDSPLFLIPTIGPTP